MCFFFNPGPVWRVPIPNRYTAKAKLCFCKNNKRTIIIKQLNVPGSFWQGRMSEDERDKIYKCTIIDFSLAQKVAPNSSPRMAFKVQEMGIDSI